MSGIALGMIIFAYLLGSISSAILICRLAGLPDPRHHGSGNPGATNVLRIGGKLAAAGVLICDVLKGMLPVWLAYLLQIPYFYLGIIAIAACLGHIYPVFFHFKGGKGVATAFGSIAAIGWDLTGLVADRAAEWLLIIRRDCQCAGGTVLCLVVQTGVYLPGRHALLSGAYPPS